MNDTNDIPDIPDLPPKGQMPDRDSSGRPGRKDKFQGGGIFRSFGRIFLREIALIGRDHSLLLTLLIAPLLYAFFYGSIYINKEEQEVKLAVVDDDGSYVSRLLIQQVDHTQAAEVVMSSSLQEARELMYRGTCQGYFYIEKGLAQHILSLHQGNVVLAVNAARFLPSSDLLASLTQVCLTVGAGVRLQYLQQSQGLNTEASLQEVMPVNVDYRPLFNERVSYGAFLLPGLLALILQQTLLIGLSSSVAAERKKDGLAGWMQASQQSPSLALWGKGSFYLLLFCIYAFFFLNVNFTLLHLPMRGSGWALSLVILLFLLTLIPMAQWVGSLFRYPLMNVQIMAFSTYPIFLITGYTWPLASLPVPLQFVSFLLPTTPFLQVFQSIVQSGASLTENANPIAHLAFLFFFYSLLCLWRLKRLRQIVAFLQKAGRHLR